MTPEQEHLMTLLLIKHGGFESVMDIWLFQDEVLSIEEQTAVDAFLSTDCTIEKPYDVEYVDDTEFPYLSVNITLDDTKTD